MLRYALKRLVSLSVSLIVAILAMVEVVPGDPAAYMLGLNAQENTLNALRDQLGLNGTFTPANPAEPQVTQGSRLAEWVSQRYRSSILGLSEARWM